MSDDDIKLADDLRAEAALLDSQARDLRKQARDLRKQAERLDPPCGMWLDGHSYRRCDRPRSKCDMHRNIPASMRPPEENTNDS